MAARLTDRQKKKIVADYVQLESYNAVGKIHGVAATTVRKIVLADPQSQEKLAKKKEENAYDILAYMESQKNVICEIIGKGFVALNSSEKLAGASPSQITTAIGTLIDKMIQIAQLRETNGSGAEGDKVEIVIDV